MGRKTKLLLGETNEKKEHTINRNAATDIRSIV